LLEEFCNIGKLVDFKKQLAILRGFNINCQVVVQSVAGLADRYEKKEWEEIISHCDTTICLGVNDLMTAQYISDKCGSVTIREDNNQMPLMPLFSPVYHSTRPYSQTRSNTKRALMMPDEIMRMDNKKCIVLLRGQKPLMLDKIVPEEFPAFSKLRYTRIKDYTPEWRKDVGAANEADAPLSRFEEPESGTDQLDMFSENYGADDASAPPHEPEPSAVEHDNPKKSWLPDVEYLLPGEYCRMPDDTGVPDSVSGHGVEVMELAPEEVIAQNNRYYDEAQREK
jgi:type IV secretion system protein VirD4